MSGHATRAGVLAAAALGAFYALVVGGVGGIAHLGQQAAEDWPWVVLILVGFGTQIALLLELRRRRRLRDAAMKNSDRRRSRRVRGRGHHDSPPRLDASGAVFRVQLDTHSVPLDLDLASSAHLRVDATDGGRASWDGSAPGGHHREGTLAFTTPVTSGANVVLTITGLPADAVGSWTAP